MFQRRESLSFRIYTCYWKKTTSSPVLLKTRQHSSHNDLNIFLSKMKSGMNEPLTAVSSKTSSYFPFITINISSVLINTLKTSLCFQITNWGRGANGCSAVVIIPPVEWSSFNLTMSYIHAGATLIYSFVYIA